MREVTEMPKGACECFACAGKGSFYGQQCKACEGRGWIGQAAFANNEVAAHDVEVALSDRNLQP